MSREAQAGRWTAYAGALPALANSHRGLYVPTRERSPDSMVCGGRTFLWGERTYVMGVVNATPDSFSGDGVGYDVEAAQDLALYMEAQGADIIDVGGESTRRYDNQPGATPVGAEEELRRVLPVLERLVQVLSVPICVDTYRPTVARVCLQAGASMVNNVWGTRADREMLEVVAGAGVPVVLMHNQEGHSYGDLVPDILFALGEAVGRALEAGVKRENVIIDPGLGFGKVADQSLEVEGRLSELGELGLPVLAGPSRKSHLGMVLDGAPPEDRLEATAAAVALCISGGADIVRVHDVREMVRVARVADAICRGWRPESWGR